MPKYDKKTAAAIIAHLDAVQSWAETAYNRLNDVPKIRRTKDGETTRVYWRNVVGGLRWAKSYVKTSNGVKRRATTKTVHKSPRGAKRPKRT